jgi:hypothetical protein
MTYREHIIKILKDRNNEWTTCAHIADKVMYQIGYSYCQHSYYRKSCGDNICSVLYKMMGKDEIERTHGIGVRGGYGYKLTRKLYP